MDTMKTITRELVLTEAKEVVMAAHGRNDFYTLAEARARLNAVIHMARRLGLLTDDVVKDIKREAKKELAEEN
ncbi:MAG: hypothetical protein IJ849_05970 [Selenomonadaceae bacterium]|nr:hypothetical protein [Selenomonadaceae bacterium]